MSGGIIRAASGRMPADHDGVPICSHMVCPKYRCDGTCEEMPGATRDEVCIPEVRDMAKLVPTKDQAASLREVVNYFDTDDHCPNCGEKFAIPYPGKCPGYDGRCGWIVKPRRPGLELIDRAIALGATRHGSARP